MSVKISALPIVTELSDGALLMGEETNGTSKITASDFKNQLMGAAVTSSYRRDALPTPAQTTITVSPTTVKIGDELYANASSVTLNLASSSSWDSSTYATASNRAGKDFYIYACVPTSGSEPKFILSANSTVPTNYTASNSRKIGGFHCLCLSVGTISGHTLSGYLTGDILPASVWDLLHRCKGENEGMVYDEYDDVWLGIYLLSYSNGKAVSVYNGVMLDGSSTPKTHCAWFTETLAKQKMRLPWLYELFTAWKGCQECVCIKDSADPNTTGGHVYTNGVRCISNIGLEDPTGVEHQWTNDYCMVGGTKWVVSTYVSSVDSSSCGNTYGYLWAVRAGGAYVDTTHCGSRCVVGNLYANSLDDGTGARCASKPRFVRL